MESQFSVRKIPKLKTACFTCTWYVPAEPFSRCHGHCVINPPVPELLDNGAHGLAIWPEVRTFMVCGSWSKANKEQAESRGLLKGGRNYNEYFTELDSH